TSSTLFPYTTLFRSEDEFGIYENRFVSTLIHRLVQFISKRVRILEEDVNTTKINELSQNVEIKIDNSIFEIDINLREKETIDKGDRKSTRLNSSHVK